MGVKLIRVLARVHIFIHQLLHAGLHITAFHVCEGREATLFLHHQGVHFRPGEVFQEHEGFLGMG